MKIASISSSETPASTTPRATPIPQSTTMLLPSNWRRDAVGIPGAIELTLEVPDHPEAEIQYAFDGALPSFWSHTNPVDILGEAGPERYGLAVERRSRNIKLL